MIQCQSQIKAARALLGLEPAEALRASGRRDRYSEADRVAPDISGAARTLWKIQTALESAGVEFISADETKGPGVRLKDLHRRGWPRRRVGAERSKAIPNMPMRSGLDKANSMARQPPRNEITKRSQLPTLMIGSAWKNYQSHVLHMILRQAN